MLEEVGRGEGVVAANCIKGELRKAISKRQPGLSVLLESSRWLVFPTLGFSMKN
jgi:hypothetical protein